MKKPQTSDFNSPDLPPSSTVVQTNEGSMVNGQQGLVGDKNIQNQGDNNCINVNNTVNNYVVNSLTHENNSSEQTSSLCLKQEQGKLVGEKIVPDDHKYDGKLVIIELKLYEVVISKKIRVMLSISFGKPEVKIPNLNKLLIDKKETIDIKFGIKNGELCFLLKNGYMPLSQRESLVNHDNNWRVTPIGKSESPVWEFELNHESSNGNELGILHGTLKNNALGILELLEANDCCELEAIFKISVNRNYIKIIALDDGKNKIHKETKIGLLLRYLETELKLGDYVSKVAIKYEPANIS